MIQWFDTYGLSDDERKDLLDSLRKRGTNGASTVGVMARYYGMEAGYGFVYWRQEGEIIESIFPVIHVQNLEV